jgi:hypothetical protein
MSEKLDPGLLDLVEQAERGVVAGTAIVQLLIGLNAPLTPADRNDLVARGLRVRSEIGDVLTGSIAVGQLRELAASPHVVKLELSAPLFPENAPRQ